MRISRFGFAKVCSSTGVFNSQYRRFRCASPGDLETHNSAHALRCLQARAATSFLGAAREHLLGRADETRKSRWLIRESRSPALLSGEQMQCSVVEGALETARKDFARLMREAMALQREQAAPDDRHDSARPVPLR